MDTQIFKVLLQTEVLQIDSQKAESGKLPKCTIVLQKFGGKYQDSFSATMFGNNALLRFNTGDIVAANLRFTAREYQNQVYQDVVINDIVKLS